MPPDQSPQRILVLVDERDKTNRAAGFAKDLALAHKSRIFLLAVLEEQGRLDEGTSAGQKARRRRTRERGTWERIYSVEAEVAGAGIAAQVLVESGTLTTGLVTALRQTKADLIVMAAESVAGAAPAVPWETLEHIACPVLILPMHPA